MNVSKLKGHLPDSVIAEIPMIIEKYDIDTALKLAHFLGQAGHESGNFKVVNENLNYSGDRLKVIFPKYFKDKDVSVYNRNPEKIANLVYGNRMGNGSESTGEGYKFRGRGYIQLTGKDNYKAFGASIGEDFTKNPDLVSSKYALASAAWFFSKNGLCSIAEKGISDDIITQITKRVNGGTIGLVDRIKHTKEFYNLLK
jgi:putative chitinase